MLRLRSIAHPLPGNYRLRFAPPQRSYGRTRKRNPFENSNACILDPLIDVPTQIPALHTHHRRRQRANISLRRLLRENRKRKNHQAEET